MDKGFIAKYLKEKSNYSLDQKKLLKEIEYAREELDRCRQYFNEVKDPRLVDYAIYTEEAAKSRYMYLLCEAKKIGLKVQAEGMLREVSAG